MHLYLTSLGEVILKRDPVVGAPGGISNPSTLAQSLTPALCMGVGNTVIVSEANGLLVLSTIRAPISSGRQGLGAWELHFPESIASRLSI